MNMKRKRYERPCIVAYGVELEHLLAYSDVDIMPGASDIGSPGMEDCKSSVWDEDYYTDFDND